MIQTLNHVYTGDCRDLIEDGVDLMCREGLTPVVVTDPPFNVGYHILTNLQSANDEGSTPMSDNDSDFLQTS